MVNFETNYLYMENTYQKGVSKLKAGQYNEAIEIFNSIIENEPENADAISERGVCHLHLKNKKAALDDMDLAVFLQPEKSYRYSCRAFTRDHFGDVKGGIEDYKKAIELDPQDAIAHNNLGLLQEKLGYMQQSKENFKKADYIAKSEIDGRTFQGVEGTPLPSNNLQEELDNQENPGYWETLMSIFSKEGRESFGRFIRSGFKKV